MSEYSSPAEFEPPHDTFGLLIAEICMNSQSTNQPATRETADVTDLWIALRRLEDLQAEQLRYAKKLNERRSFLGAILLICGCLGAAVSLFVLPQYAGHFAIIAGIGFATM